MTKDEALRLALKTLKADRVWLETDAPTVIWEKNNEAIKAINEALETKEGLLDRKSYLLGLYDQKPWVGMTDEEMRELEKQFEAERVRTSDEEYLVIYPAAYWQWQRAIEAKLKEKNN